MLWDHYNYSFIWWFCVCTLVLLVSVVAVYIDLWSSVWEHCFATAAVFFKQDKNSNRVLTYLLAGSDLGCLLFKGILRNSTSVIFLRNQTDLSLFWWDTFTGTPVAHEFAQGTRDTIWRNLRLTSPASFSLRCPVLQPREVLLSSRLTIASYFGHVCCSPCWNVSPSLRKTVHFVGPAQMVALRWSLFWCPIGS